MDKKPAGVTFDIVLDENVARREPKRVVLLRNKQKEQLTADEVEKRQKMAEQRRQARIEARLKRMHEREEATKKLACNVDILLQQQSLRTARVQHPDDPLIMSRREILKTAYDVIKGFNEMQQQLLNVDLKVEEKKGQTCQVLETNFQTGLISSKKSENIHTEMTDNHQESGIPLSDSSSETKAEQKPAAVVFEIPCDDLGVSKHCSKKPAIASLLKKNLKQSDQEMAAIKLEAKQQQAAERRQKRLENKVQRTRESREALMELRTKVNKFRQHQAALKGEADPGLQLSETEAALLARDIADGFSSIHSRYEMDLERAEGFIMDYEKLLM